MTTQIRLASPADKPAWLAMRQALWPDEGDLSAGMDELLVRENYRVWLAFDGDLAIGFAEAGLRPYANGCDSQPVPFLEGIWVEETHRKEGVGRALVSALEDWARALGILELGSDTWLNDLRSQQVHGHWGFEETERVVYFRKKLLP